MRPTGREIVYALYGAWRLLRLDRNGMAYFDRSVDGFWKSFFAAVLVAPGYAILLFLHYGTVEIQVGLAHLLAVQLLAYVLQWVAFPVAVHRLCEIMGKERAFLGYIVAFNWASTLQIAILVPAAVVGSSLLLPLPAAAMIYYSATAIVLAYKWYITRVALDIAGWPASGFVILDLVLGIFITTFADGFVT